MKKLRVLCLTSVGALLIASLGLAAGAGVANSSSAAQDSEPSRILSVASVVGDRDGGQAFREPVTLSSVDGVLEVELTARQGRATIDTAAAPVGNALLFDYRVVRGSASNGVTSATNSYPAPTLHVQPGERLIVHLANDMTKLRIADFMDPTWPAKDDKVPVELPTLTDSPVNNHVHGIHTSPQGNSDNVLIAIPAGSANTYTYDVPKNHPQGLYWYHSHLHMLTTAHVYRGLAGMLVIGEADGAIPLVQQNNLPVRTMALQYNYVFNRSGAKPIMNNVYWPSMQNVAKKPTAAQLSKGTYRPLLTPVDFKNSPVGTQYAVTWTPGQAGTGTTMYQYLPSNLTSFVSDDSAVRISANPGLPESQRDLQYTVNGQFQPVISTPPGQTEIWALGNFTDAGTLRVAIQNTATGEYEPLRIVAQDGATYGQVQSPLSEDGKTLVIAPASRYALAVTMPQTGSLRLVMPPYKGTIAPFELNFPAVAYTNNGTDNPPAVTGTMSTDPAWISYDDGFMLFPTQTLLSAEPSAGVGTTVPFNPGQDLGVDSGFVDTSQMTPDLTRTLTITAGPTNNHANPGSPLAVAYQFNNNQFPNIPMFQPRLDTVEQWNFVNKNNDTHPIHVHVNDFQVVDYYDPGTGDRWTDLPFGQDNQIVPGALMDGQGQLVSTGRMSLRTYFQDFIGAFVFHCHRLNHEDAGLMALVNVIPNVTAYAVVERTPGRSTRVRVYDQATGKTLATVIPFAGVTGPVDVTMGDVNGDAVLDLVVGAGAGQAPRVRAWSGDAEGTGKPFQQRLFDVLAFDSDFRGGVSVATGNITGQAPNLDTGTGGDSVVVGTGPGMRATVKVLASGLNAGKRPAFTSFYPYGSFRGGVDVATGLVDLSGREVIVTAPGAGAQPRVKTWIATLMTSNGHDNHHAGHETMAQGAVQRAGSFLAFESSYRGGVSIATGWVAGREGGFSRIIAGKSSGSSEVSVWTSGSKQEGHPTMYVEPLHSHEADVEYIRALKFAAFPGSTAGIDVTTAASPRSADLVVAERGGSSIVVFNIHRPKGKAKAWVAQETASEDYLGTVSAVGGR
ncbi:MAG: hypothetical protein B7C55_08100 [Actinomycetales bacterium mxb001]|nr:MAG: hypothetical protein B7C55_08100 [Actinomycetales bacterium mxb001]